MTERTDTVCEEHPLRRWPHGLDPVFPDRDCPGPGMLPQNQEQLDALLRAVNGDSDRPWCCYINDARRICTSDAEWDLTFGSAPDDNTQSCTEHVGFLLGEDGGSATPLAA